MGPIAADDRSGVASEHESGFVRFGVGFCRHLLWVRPDECRDQDDFGSGCHGKTCASCSNYDRESRLFHPDQTNP